MVEVSEAALIFAAARSEATRAGMLDLDTLPLAFPYLAEAKVTSAGNVEGVEQAIAAVKTAKPYLFDRTNARTMTAQEYAAHKARKLRDTRTSLESCNAAATLARIEAKYARKA